MREVLLARELLVSRLRVGALEGIAEGIFVLVGKVDWPSVTGLVLGDLVMLEVGLCKKQECLLMCIIEIMDNALMLRYIS